MTSLSTKYKDIVAAAQRLLGHAVATPVLRSNALDKRLNARVVVKAESLQVTGSFKFRGAYNLISQIPSDQREKGVVAWSSGNHAQGVAAAAQYFKVPATIVMPDDAPKAKIDGTSSRGARIVHYRRDQESRETIGENLAQELGATIVPPYDHPAIIAGQGTVGLEAAAQCRALGLELDLALAPCGGGGLIAGTSIALKHHYGGLPIYAVEPDGFDDTARSLSSGNPQGHQDNSNSICDALLAPMPGALTFSINKTMLAGALTVSDQEVLDAMQVAARDLKLVLEPGGAVALAAILANKLDVDGKTILLIASGGNVDAEMFGRAIAMAN